MADSTTWRKQTIDFLDYLLVTQVYDRHPGKKVTIFDPTGKVALMGCIPHEPEGEINLRLKPGVLRINGEFLN